MKYNIEIVRNELLEYGYYLDTNEYINSKAKMPCHDEDGFKYLITMDDYRTKRHPYKFIKSNPYTLENIQLVLNKETDGVEIKEKEYKKSCNKMEFKCSCGSTFYMNLSQFVSGKRYCNYCAKSKRYDGLVDYTSLVKDKCKKRNYVLITPSINRSNEKFEYICNKHKEKGVQTSSPNQFLNMKKGCYYCGIESRGIKHRVNLDNAIKLTEEKGFEYVDSFYAKRYQSSSSKLQLVCYCKKHKDRGVQIIDYQNLKNNKSGCIYCKGFGRTKEILQKEFDDSNFNITIIDFKSYSDITVSCDKCGNIWQTYGINIMQGHGCPKCKKSNYERVVENILIDNNIHYIPQYKTSGCIDTLPLPFDFFLDKNNTIIEVDGQGHFKPTNFNGISDEMALEQFIITKNHDNIKNKFCEANNINMVRIPYYVIDDKNIDTEKYILEKI